MCPSLDTHRCPARPCSAAVPNRMLACPQHWAALSKPVQDAIYATARKSMLHPDRRAALDAALEEWRAS